MSEPVAALVADLVREGVSADLVGRVAAALAAREVVPVMVRDEGAERRREADRNRKAIVRGSLRTSAESADPPDVPPLSPAPLSPPLNPPGDVARDADAGEKPSAKAKLSTIEGWSPNEADREVARQLGWSEDEIDESVTECRDYWRGEKRASWSATWRTRVRQLGARRSRPPSRAGPAARPSSNPFNDMLPQNNGHQHDRPRHAHDLDLSAEPPASSDGSRGGHPRQ